MWTRPPEPDDLENEGLWWQPFWERRPDVRFCGHQSPVLKVTTHDLGDAVEIRVRDNGPGIPAGN